MAFAARTYTCHVKALAYTWILTDSNFQFNHSVSYHRGWQSYLKATELGPTDDCVRGIQMRGESPKVLDLMGPLLHHFKPIREP